MELMGLFPIANLILEVASTAFITFVFFDLLFIDRNLHLSNLSEKFEKFKRYDVFKNSLIFLVLSLYCAFFAKLSLFLGMPQVAFEVFTLIANIFLLLFVFQLFQLLHKYVPKND
jgi:hypothetical protein